MKTFISLYKQKNIIYPRAIARHFGISLNEAYKKLEDYKAKNQDIVNLYMIKCPVCNRIAYNERFYSINAIDTDYEIGCNHCDCEFIPNIENDVMVLYEKK